MIQVQQFQNNIIKIGGIIKAFYDCERTDDEHYPNIQQIFKYCNLTEENEENSVFGINEETNLFTLSETEAFYLGNYVLLHYYIKKYESTILVEMLNTYTLPEPIFNVNYTRFCDVMLLEYFDYYRDTHKDDWKKIVEFFEPFGYSPKLGKHLYVHNDANLYYDGDFEPSKILKLRNFHMDDLSEYTSLKQLSLYTHVDNVCDTLEFLCCIDSQTNITNFSQLTNLKTFVCCKTSIIEIPNTLVNLEFLDCSDTDVSEIPDTLINLKKLYCSNTQVSKIPNSLVKLEKLYCCYLRITEIPKELTNLKILRCYSSEITEIPDSLRELIELECCNTKIVKLPFNLIKLKKLHCSDNKIKRIPSSFELLGDLKCSYTKIIKIPHNFYNLKHLDCSHTPLKYQPNTFLLDSYIARGTQFFS